MRTEKLRSDMPGLRLVGGTKSGDASKLFGPVKAGLTTSQAILNQQLTESLNSLEKKVATLESRFSEVCVISLGDILRRAERLLSTIRTDTTDV